MSGSQWPVRWQRFQSVMSVVVVVALVLSVDAWRSPSGATSPTESEHPVESTVAAARSARSATTTRKSRTKRRAAATKPVTRRPVQTTTVVTVQPGSSSGTGSMPASAASSEPTTTLASVSASVSPTVPRPLPSPAEYLSDALSFIERYSVRRRIVDVKAITDRARAAGANASSLADLYPVLRQAVKELGDGHSAFLDPAAARSLLDGSSTGFGLKVYPPDVIFVVPGSPAEMAGIRTLDRVVLFNGKPFASTSAADRAVDVAVIRVNRPLVGELEFTVRRGELQTAELPAARALDGRLGYLELPGSTGKPANEQAFSETGARAVAAVEQQVSPCGWVLDLRRNSGGFPFSMMSVLEPFLPEQTVGGFVYGDDKREQLRFSAGKVLIDNRAVWTNPSPARVRDSNVPIAVLTSGLTGSAGEIATIAFIGRPGSRSFGAPTVGVTSANVGVRLPDDAFLMVTHSYDLDRTGKVYDGPITPDESVPVDWSVFGTSRDPAINAATTWLGAQPSCAGRNP